jgi:hypothetical protein
MRGYFGNINCTCAESAVMIGAVFDAGPVGEVVVIERLDQEVVVRTSELIAGQCPNVNTQ